MPGRGVSASMASLPMSPSLAPGEPGTTDLSVRRTTSMSGFGDLANALRSGSYMAGALQGLETLITAPQSSTFIRSGTCNRFGIHGGSHLSVKQRKMGNCLEVSWSEGVPEKAGESNTAGTRSKYPNMATML